MDRDTVLGGRVGVNDSGLCYYCHYCSVRQAAGGDSLSAFWGLSGPACQDPFVLRPSHSQVSGSWGWGSTDCGRRCQIWGIRVSSFETGEAAVAGSRQERAEAETLDPGEMGMLSEEWERDHEPGPGGNL